MAAYDHDQLPRLRYCRRGGQIDLHRITLIGFGDASPSLIDELGKPELHRLDRFPRSFGKIHQAVTEAELAFKSDQSPSFLDQKNSSGLQAAVGGEAGASQGGRSSDGEVLFCSSIPSQPAACLPAGKDDAQSLVQLFGITLTIKDSTIVTGCKGGIGRAFHSPLDFQALDAEVLKLLCHRSRLQVAHGEKPPVSLALGNRAEYFAHRRIGRDGEVVAADLGAGAAVCTASAQLLACRAKA